MPRLSSNSLKQEQIASFIKKVPNIKMLTLAIIAIYDLTKS